MQPEEDLIELLVNSMQLMHQMPEQSTAACRAVDPPSWVGPLFCLAWFQGQHKVWEP
jgi:hypothetical protein